MMVQAPARRLVIDGTTYLVEPDPFAEGGQSRLCRAKDLQGNFWIVKMPRPDADAGTLVQFNREFTILKGLDHPAILWCEGYQKNSDTEQYAVIEPLGGGDLINDQGTIEVDRIIDIGVQVCNVLDYLSRQQPPIVHRDVKPENLMWLDGKAERIKVVDFGIARWTRELATVDTFPFGSTGYMPPELFYSSEQTGPESDIYSLGRTLLSLLSPVDPAQGPNRPDVKPMWTSQDLAGEVADPHRRRDAANGHKDGLLGIIAKATHLDRKKRYQNAAAMRLDLVKLAKERGCPLTGLERICPRCKHSIPLNANYCNFDGYPVQHAAQAKRLALLGARQRFVGSLP